MQIQRLSLSSLLFCLVLTGVALGQNANPANHDIPEAPAAQAPPAAQGAQAAQAAPAPPVAAPGATIDFSGPVDPGTTLKIKGIAGLFSLSVYNPKAAASCNPASLPDDLTTLLKLVPDLAAPLSTSTTVTVNPSATPTVTLASKVNSGEKLCLVAFAKDDPGTLIYSTSIAAVSGPPAPDPGIGFSQNPVTGSSSIEVTGAKGNKITGYLFASDHKPASEIKNSDGSSLCTPGDLLSGAPKLVFANPPSGDSGSSITLTAVAPAAQSIQLASPLAVGALLCLEDTTTGKLSYFETVKDPAPGLRYSKFFTSFIGGAEESGFSSDNINTNAFISAFIRSGYFLNLGSHHQFGLAPWGRVRLLSAPGQSAPNVVATITNPTGQLTQSNLSSVGAVTDYVLGGELRLYQQDTPSETNRISLIGDIGETTPLNTATPNIFSAPQPNTQDCMNLLNQYKGLPYSNYLASGASLSTPACLENPAAGTGTAYSYVAFTEQKRTGFLFKYGGGFRMARIALPQQQGGSPAPYLLDVTLGQDESITGGRLHSPVFRLDGQMPFPITGSTSYLYIFGSSEVRLRQSENLPAINLGTIQGTAPTIPSPSVVVLPTQQPDRDFYRIGVGLNLTALISSWTKGSSGANQTPPASAPATPAK